MRLHELQTPAVALAVSSLLGPPALAGGVSVEPIPDPPFVGAGPPIRFGFDGDSLFGKVIPPSSAEEAAYRWSATGGFELLPAGGPLGCDLVDADLGSRNIAGVRDQPVAKAGVTHPTLLRAPTASPGNPIVDGLAVTGSFERKPVVSGNGKVILRTYRHPSPLQLYGNVFAWTVDTGEWTERGGVPAPGGAPDFPTFVLDVDGSGATFVGTYATSSSAVDPYGPGSRRPMVFRNGSFATLPVPTSSLDGFADRISTNGRVILGGTLDGLSPYVWRRSPSTGQFQISGIPVPPGGTQPRITSFTYNGRLGLGTYRTSGGQVRTMIWRDTGGAIDAAAWIDGLGLAVLGWTGFQPEQFSDDGRTLLGRATSDGVTRWVRVRGYDLPALLGPCRASASSPPRRSSCPRPPSRASPSTRGCSWRAVRRTRWPATTFATPSSRGPRPSRAGRPSGTAPRRASPRARSRSRRSTRAETGSLRGPREAIPTAGRRTARGSSSRRPPGRPT